MPSMNNGIISMSTFRGRAPSGLISRETGNYAWVGENGEIIVDGSHCLSDNGENLLAVDPTDKGLSLDRSAVVGLIKEIAGTGGGGSGSCSCSATVADRAAIDALFN